MNTTAIVRLFTAKRVLLGLCAVALLVSVGAWLFQPSLDAIHRSIERNYEGVTHISADDFMTLNSDDVVVFDVRESAEFDVSRIAGAVQLSPDIDIEEFEEDYKDLIVGKQVVFYCSVGRRSTDMLAKLTPVLRDSGVNTASNLTGGLFKWVNQSRPIDGSGVHPYNDYWGRLISDQSKVNYRPSSVESN